MSKFDHLTTADRIWLTDTFAQYMNKPLRKELEVNVTVYLIAEEILKGLDRLQPRDCDCKLPNLQREVNDLYREYLKQETGIKYLDK